MSYNDKIPSRDFGDSLQLTYWILDSVAMCHMTLQAWPELTMSISAQVCFFINMLWIN